METIAVYWEPRVRTYGFEQVTGLSLVELTIDPEGINTLAPVILDLGNVPVRLYFILAQNAGDQGMRILLLVAPEWEKKLIVSIRRIFEPPHKKTIQVTAPVGLLYFHGPHFGDRYGIAHSAFGALSKKTIPILAAGCSSSSIYLVLHEKMLKEGRDLLSEAFEIPDPLRNEN